MAQPSIDSVPGAVPDDGALVRRCQDGDLDAFNTLVERHQRSVFNLCFRMLGSLQAAEDSAQEAFISAWRTIASCRGASFRPWLMRIAGNACIDELRRRGRRYALSIDAALPDTDAPPDVADVTAGPEELALQAEQRTAIQAALLRLPEDQRLAVIMCDIEGYSYVEIAESMRCSVGTVKSRIARGREKLRVLLSGSPGTSRTAESS